MKLLQTILVSLAIVMALPAVCQGEELPDIPPPKPPFIALPPASGSWIIKVIASRAPARESDKTGPGTQSYDQVICVKSGEVKHDVLVSSNGSSQEVWYFGKFALLKYENANKVAVLDAASFGKEGGSRTGSLTLGPTFPGFGWLKQKYYRNAVKLGPKLCYYFQIPGTQPPDSPLASINSSAALNDSVEAWIDVETKYPVAIKSEGVVCTYEFRAAPSTALQLPVAYAEALRQKEAQINHLKALEQIR